MKMKLAIALLLTSALAAFTTGCHTPTHAITLKPVSFPDVSIPQPSIKRNGTLGVQFSDARAEKPNVGKLGGRIIRVNAILTVNGGLEPRLTEIFKGVLERAGYTVVQGAQPMLEGEVREFLVYGNGWTQGAKEKIRVRLRDKEGHVLWERSFKGEDGGIDMAESFAEKSMNVALTRLLADAMDEFTSESFSQSVGKGAPDQ